MMQRFLVTLALVCSMVLAPTPAAAQPDAAQLLESSARAMESLQTMRFAASMDIAMVAPRQDQTLSLAMSGEFQQPDRAYISLNSEAMAVSTEVIVVGTTVWTRDSGGVWTEVASSNMPFTRPSSVGANADLYARLMRNPQVVDQGSSYRVSGDLDLEGAIFEDPSDLNAGLAMAQMYGLGESGVQVGMVIDKQTLYMTEYSIDMTMLVPDRQARPSVSIRMTVVFSGFDDPAISVQPPR